MQFSASADGRVSRRGVMRGIAGVLAAPAAVPAAGLGSARITGIRTFVVGNPWKNWVFVKVSTDTGLFGWGEATSGLETKPPEAQVHELERFVLGEDAFQPERLWQKMHQGLILG